MSTNKLHFSSFVLDNIKKKLKIKTDTDLAHRLNVSRSVISTWRSRDNINLRTIKEALPNISLDDIVNNNAGKTTDEQYYEHSVRDYGGERDDKTLKIIQLQAEIRILKEIVHELAKKDKME